MGCVMYEEVADLNVKAVQDIVMMQEDLSSAIAVLPDFGYYSPENLENIKRAQVMLQELRSTLENFVDTGNTYQETFVKLKKLLSEAGVSECVNDLIAVRKNSRRKEEPLFGSINKK